MGFGKVGEVSNLLEVTSMWTKEKTKENKYARFLSEVRAKKSESLVDSYSKICSFITTY